MDKEFEKKIRENGLDVKMNDDRQNQQMKIDLFKGKEIRKVWHENEWWFSVVDIVEVLSDSQRPGKYWSDLKKTLMGEGFMQLSENIIVYGGFYEKDYIYYCKCGIILSSILG